MSLVPRWYDWEKPFSLMERDFFRRDFFNDLVPRDFFAPHFRPWDKWDNFRGWDSYVKPMDELQAAMNQLALASADSKITADNEKFQVNVDVQHFAPEDISVKVVDGVVTIEGKHRERWDPHGYVARQFVRKYTLPPGCLPDTVESKLSSDGVLTVTAPRVLALPSTGEKIVPIWHTGPLKHRAIKYY